MDDLEALVVRGRFKFVYSRKISKLDTATGKGFSIDGVHFFLG